MVDVAYGLVLQPFAVLARWPGRPRRPSNDTALSTGGFSRHLSLANLSLVQVVVNSGATIDMPFKHHQHFRIAGQTNEE
jgi:hypothetical protein